jgi:hypothetical protein
MQKLVLLLHLLLLLLLAKAKALLVLQLDFPACYGKNAVARAADFAELQQSLLYCIQIQKLATAAQVLVLSN